MVLELLGVIMIKEFIKEARDMPHFTDQDRPKKVKEIYRALKREHPSMPAEMKARIAARQGRHGKQHQGPPYKGPLTKKGSKMSLERRENLPSKSFAVPKSKAKKIGVSSEIKGESKGKYPIPDKAHARNALSRVSAFGSPSEKALVRAKVHSKFPDIGKEKKSMLKEALQKRASDLRNDIVNRAMACGEGLEKTASEQYFHDLRKPDQDVEMLGQKFCKLAHGIERDPWELALEVADNFPAYAVLSKTASDPKARELANFYLDWSEEMEKTAFLGKAWQMGKAGLKAIGGKAKGLTSAGKMNRAITGQTQHTVGGAMRRAGKQYDATKALGGGSFSRGQAVRQAEKAERAAAKAAPTTATHPQAAAGAQPSREEILKSYTAKPTTGAPTTGAAPKPGINWGHAALGGAALGATGGGGLYAYNKLKGQPQPAAAYGY